jgi:hypothetical protein
MSGVRVKSALQSMGMLTDSRLLHALKLRSRVALKRELLRLCRAHDAAAAFLWTASPTGDKGCGIEYAGSREALPRPTDMQGPITRLCEQRTLHPFDGEDREVVLITPGCATTRPCCSSVLSIPASLSPTS